MRFSSTLSTFLIAMVFIAIQSEAQEFVTDGLVSFWTFDEKDIDDDIVKDIWGGHHGTMKDTKIVAGIINEALEFNGSSGSVSVPNDPDFDLADAFTLEVWINVSSLQHRNSIMTKFASPAKMYLEYAVEARGLWVWLGHSNGSAFVQAIAAGEQTQSWVDQWTHVVATWDKDEDDGLLGLYANGEEGNYELQNSLKKSITPNDLPWTIGAMPSAPGRVFDGKIDEVRIYSKRLSDAEISKNFEARSNILAVRPAGKLTTTWCMLKLGR